MAPSYLAGIVIILAQILPLIGIDVNANDLSTTLTTLIQIAAGLIIIVRQLSAGRATVFGTRPAGFQG